VTTVAGEIEDHRDVTAAGAAEVPGARILFDQVNAGSDHAQAAVQGMRVRLGRFTGQDPHVRGADYRASQRRQPVAFGRLEHGADRVLECEPRRRCESAAVPDALARARDLARHAGANVVL